MAIIAVPNAPEAQWDDLIIDDPKTPVALGAAISRRPMRPFTGGASNPEPFRWSLQSSGTAATRTLTLPTSVVAGQVAIACVGWNNGGGFTLTSLSGTSSGWTQLGPGTFPVDNTLTSTLYYKRLESSDAGKTVTFNFSGSLKATVGMVAYEGIPEAVPAVAVLADTGTDEVHETPSLVTGDPSIIVNFVVERQATVWSTTAEFAPGRTERFVQSGGGASAGVTMIGADTGATYVTAGTVGATSAAFTDDGGAATPSPNAIGWTVALTPGEVIAPPVPVSSQRGALPLGTAAYPVPATGARFIAPGGNDTTGAGTQVSPWATFAKAIGSAVSGDTIVARAGVYREIITVPATKSLTIQPYPNESVQLNGTALQGFGWTADSSPGAPCWKKNFGTAPSRAYTGASPIDPAYPLSTWPDMVFLNGLPATQVATKAELAGVGAFFWLENPGTSGVLWVNFDPANATIEAATRTEGVVVRSDNSVVRGFQVYGFASIYDNHAAVRAIDVDNVTFENMDVALNAMGGIVLDGCTNSTVRFNSCSYNGANGVKMLDSPDCIVEFNKVTGANYSHFNGLVDGAGVKVTTSLRPIVRYNQIDTTTGGRGIWVAATSTDPVVIGNKVTDADLSGFYSATSSGALIAGNLFIHCDKGVYTQSGTGKIHHNTFVNNRIAWHFENAVGFEAKSNIISAGDFSTSYIMWVEDPDNVDNYTSMSYTSNYDWVYRKSSTTTPVFARVPTGSSPSAPTNYGSMFTYNAATGQEANGTSSDNVTPDTYLNGDYTPKVGKVAPAAITAVRQALGWAGGLTNPGAIQT